MMLLLKFLLLIMQLCINCFQIVLGELGREKACRRTRSYICKEGSKSKWAESIVTKVFWSWVLLTLHHAKKRAWERRGSGGRLWNSVQNLVKIWKRIKNSCVWEFMDCKDLGYLFERRDRQRWWRFGVCCRWARSCTWVERSLDAAAGAAAFVRRRSRLQQRNSSAL